MAEDNRRDYTELMTLVSAELDKLEQRVNNKIEAIEKSLECQFRMSVDSIREIFTTHVKQANADQEHNNGRFAELYQSRNNLEKRVTALETKQSRDDDDRGVKPARQSNVINIVMAVITFVSVLIAAAALTL